MSAAIMIDGGWRAFIDVYGRIYAPFIVYSCKYYNVIEYNLVESLNFLALNQKVDIEFKN